MTHWIKAAKVKLALGVLLAIVLFFWLAFDPLLKWGLVRAGEAAAGAKVDVASLTTHALKGSLTIRGLAVANKNEPMKNLFQADEADFQFSPGQALRAKVVIPLAAVKGLRFGTARKTSGALPRSKPGKLGQLISRQLAPAKENFGADVSQVKAAAAKVDPSKLESLKSLDAAQKQLTKAGDDLKSQAGVDKIQAQIKDIQEQLKQLQTGGGSPADIARKAQLAAQLRGKIKDLLAQVDQSRAAVNARISDVQAKLKQADDLRHKDVNGLLEAAGLPTLDAQSLTRHLLGPAAAKKMDTAVYWISYIRKRSASPAEKAQEPPPARRRGLNIEFPNAHSYPQFLLEKAQLSGTLADLFQGRDMDLSGELAGLTSNPPLYGRPTRLTLKGRTAQGGPAMGLEASLDRTRRPGGMDVALHYAGLPLSGVGLGDDKLGAALKGGVGRLDGDIKIVGDQWNGSVTLQASQVALDPKVALAGPAAGFARAALSSISRFNVKIGISGKEDDLRFAISSDLGATVAEGMKKAFSGELAKQRRELEAKVDALYSARAKELQAQNDALAKKYLGPLDAQRAKLQEQLNQAVSKGLGRSIPGLDKLFR